MPDPRSLTDLATLIDHGCLVRLITFHLFINQEKCWFLTQVGHLSRPFLDWTDMNILVLASYVGGDTQFRGWPASPDQFIDQFVVAIRCLNEKLRLVLGIDPSLNPEAIRANKIEEGPTNGTTR